MEKKNAKMVGVGINAAVKNPQWTRVHGPDVEPQHAVRADLNKARLVAQDFIKACKVVGIKATRRQASKWNNKKGAAYNVANRIEMQGFVFGVV